MNALTRFTRFTTQDEPVLSAGLLAAIVLAVIDRYVFHLTDDDAQLFAFILVPIVGALLARWKAYSPTTVQKIKDGEAEG